MKFLCSYDGKILPRHPDGKLCYHGGHTRVLAVDRSISFFELMAKMKEMCGKSVNLRCKLPNEDLDALVSVTCDEDLSNLIEEYDHFALASASASTSTSVSSTLKIRSFLSPPKINTIDGTSKLTPPHSTSKSSIISNHTCYGHRNDVHIYLVHNSGSS